MRKNINKINTHNVNTNNLNTQIINAQNINKINIPSFVTRTSLIYGGHIYEFI